MKNRTLLIKLAVLVAAMLCTLGASAAEAYVCYTESNEMLTFYYDNLRASRSGRIFDLNTGSNAPEWYNDGTYSSVMQAVFDPSFADARPTTAYAWFGDMSNLLSITGMEYLNTSQMTSMTYMFCGCKALEYLDVSHFNTENVRYMTQMFALCNSLTSLNLSSFNTSNVTNMSYMFYYCSGLKTIYANDGWSTASVTSSTGMFNNCTSLVGGKGTTYNSNYIDKTYAHIDGGTSNPGYLTQWKEGYACYTPSNTTLTFYYDNKRASRTGTTYDLPADDDAPGWNIDGTRSSVTRVVFNSSFADARPTSTGSWFMMNNLASITGIEYLNTSEVTDMGLMFFGCESLTSLDVSGFNTAKVTDMAFMFCNCSSLTSLDVSHFNTSEVTTMCRMFSVCSSLTSLDLSGFNTAKVKDMESMFWGCSSLTSLDLTSFNTAKVTTMESMFRICSGLTSLILGNFNTTNVTNMSYMFSSCSSLKTIYADDGWSTASVTSSTGMFNNCTSLVGGKGTTYNSNYIDKTYAHIDGGTSNPGYLTQWKEGYACYTPSNTTLTFYYDNKRASRTGTTYDLNADDNNPGWKSDGTNTSVTRVVFDPSFAAARPTTTYRWFNNMTGLTTISGLNYLNTSEVTNMQNMFSGSGLTSLDLSGFNTANVTDMSYMFYNCSNLRSLDVSGFNTSNVTDMRTMFYGCSNLTSLDVSSFNTSSAKNLSYMFRYCSGLTRLDLGNFNTSRATNMSYMFYGCSGLNTIYAGDGWNTAAVTTSANMFWNCSNIRGGQGTTYDANHIDKAYAHIDGGPSNPGYFTEKVDFLHGDVNGDGAVNIADVTALIDLLLGNGGNNNPAADCNDDGAVNIADVTKLIDYLLSGAWD